MLGKKDKKLEQKLVHPDLSRTDKRQNEDPPPVDGKDGPAAAEGK